MSIHNESSNRIVTAQILFIWFSLGRTLLMWQQSCSVFHMDTGGCCCHVFLFESVCAGHWAVCFQGMPIPSSTHRSLTAKSAPKLLIAEDVNGLWTRGDQHTTTTRLFITSQDNWGLCYTWRYCPYHRRIWSTLWQLRLLSTFNGNGSSCFLCHMPTQRSHEA